MDRLVHISSYVIIGFLKKKQPNLFPQWTKQEDKHASDHTQSLYEDFLNELSHFGLKKKSSLALKGMWHKRAVDKPKKVLRIAPL